MEWVVTDVVALNHDHGLILHRRRMVDAASVALQPTTAEIIITDRVQAAAMQVITANATETLISGTTVIIGSEIGTVTEIETAAGAATAPRQHLLL